MKCDFCNCAKGVIGNDELRATPHGLNAWLDIRLVFEAPSRQHCANKTHEFIEILFRGNYAGALWLDTGALNLLVQISYRHSRK
ncbi:MAG: hypothetical protein IH987_05565 [Planctomycetes bacterium]|nr:hypothetical protein [Planctomycetota bacterium]